MLDEIEGYTQSPKVAAEYPKNLWCHINGEIYIYFKIRILRLCTFCFVYFIDIDFTNFACLSM